VNLLAELLRETGFSEIRIYDLSDRSPFSYSMAPFILGRS